MPSQIRQLAAIMFTDIVSYTALMGEDEHKAFELLKKNRAVQRSINPLSFPILKKAKSKVQMGLGIFIILYSLIINGCNSESSQHIIRLDESIITNDSLTVKIKQLIKNADVHGMAVTVFGNDRIIYQQTFGYKNYEKQLLLTDSTNLYGASLSKAVFSVLVMKLVEEKVIDLDTPLESYLPRRIYEYEPLTKWHDNFADLKQDTLYHKITARMCLNHTTGFPNWRWLEPDQKLRVKFEPGSRYSYSGEGFVYLQVIIEKILGKDLEELAQEKVFGPIGMDNSSYRWKTYFENDFAYGHSTSGNIYQKDTDNEPRAGSTLETTSRDYSNFLQSVLLNKIVTQSSWDELFKSQISIKSVKQFGTLALIDSTLNDNIKLSYGLGWGLLETPYGIGAFKEGHGDGFQHYSIIFPKAKKGILLMTNSDNGEGVFKELLEVAIGDTYTPLAMAELYTI